jgi:hypothetical protein
MDNVRPSKAPSLLTGTEAYERQAQDQLNNQLRIYFNQVDTNNQVMIEAINSLTVMAWISEGSF